MPSWRAFEVVGKPESNGPFVFTCEHASNALPTYLSASETDRTLLHQHWGWDIGAADVTRELVATFGGQAVLAGVSRLVVDLNRDPSSDELFLRQADGDEIGFNCDLDSKERKARHESVYARYHEAIEEVLAEREARDPSGVVLLSIHSFTPVLRGLPRTLEIGVLFDDYDALAVALASGIRQQGFACELNQPYSGKPPNGLIYSAARHGRAAEVAYLELEIRQDLIATPQRAAAVVEKLAEPLRGLATSRGLADLLG